jgi:hypothetical protein
MPACSIGQPTVEASYVLKERLALVSVAGALWLCQKALQHSSAAYGGIRNERHQEWGGGGLQR